MNILYEVCRPCVVEVQTCQSESHYKIKNSYDFISVHKFLFDVFSPSKRFLSQNVKVVLFYIKCEIQIGKKNLCFFQMVAPIDHLHDSWHYEQVVTK